MRGIPITEQGYRELLNRTRGPKVRTERIPYESKSEDKAVTLLRMIVEAGIPGVWYREFTFHETRGWRLDVACPSQKLSAEIDGQVHRLKDKFARDIERHNALMIDGWRWVRVTPAQVDNGEALVLVRALVNQE